MPKRSRLYVAVAVLIAGLLGLAVALPRLPALALIVRVSKRPGVLGWLARLPAGKVTEGPVVEVPTRHGPVPGRLYRKHRSARRTIILVPGLHMDGLHEARLVGLAKELAATGPQVLTLAPPDLTQYRVTPRTVDEMEDAIAWAAARPDLAPDGKVGLTAFSFAGGLALVAAGRSTVNDNLAFVLSFGGHGDLPRVLRYLCGEATPLPVSRAEASTLAYGGEEIRIPPPHDYGAVAALLNLADRIVPGPQVAPLQEAVTLFLRASSIDRQDRGRAETIFARARQLGQAMPEPSRTLMRYVSDRDVAHLGRVLEPRLTALDLPAALSPERSPLPRVPVFLLHGAADSVIPASEMLALARRLRAASRVRAFASQLITHAEADRRAALAEMWSLSAFWGDLLSR